MRRIRYPEHQRPNDPIVSRREARAVKPATAGLAATLLGILALITHTAMTFMTLLGTGLASTPDTQVPQRTETLWGIALWGTPVAALALFLVLVNWRKPAAIAYAAIWLALRGS